MEILASFGNTAAEYTKVNGELFFNRKKMISLCICKPYLIYLNHDLRGFETCITVVVTHLILII